MSNQPSAVAFGKERAASYDKQFAKMAPMRDVINLCMRMVLSELPAEARILCVGAGTGLEMLYLGEHFPQWHFTAVEPAPAMLEVCRQRMEESGLTSRCTFHEGYLDSLPDAPPFDAATCLLVSQFLVDEEKRRQLFGQIAARLRPEAILVSCDLTSDMASPEYASLLEVWLQMLRYSDMPEEKVEAMRTVFGRDVALLPPQTIAAMLQESHFELPVQFVQTLLIHGWYAKRAR